MAPVDFTKRPRGMLCEHGNFVDQGCSVCELDELRSRCLAAEAALADAKKEESHWRVQYAKARAGEHTADIRVRELEVAAGRLVAAFPELEAWVKLYPDDERKAAPLRDLMKLLPAQGEETTT